MAEHHSICFIHQEGMVRIDYDIWADVMQWDFAKTN